MYLVTVCGQLFLVLLSCLLFQTVQVPVYSEQEYQVHLHDDGWTKAETDHLFDLCKRFDLRFVVVHDRYDHQQYRVIPLSVFQCYFFFFFFLIYHVH